MFNQAALKQLSRSGFYGSAAPKADQSPASASPPAHAAAPLRRPPFGAFAAMSPAEPGMLMGQGPFGPDFFFKAALAGAIGCSVTHGGMTPVDVVKTKIQLDPAKYSKGIVDAFSQVIKTEGAGALATGLVPTAQGYAIQGFFKFGGVEFFKVKFTEKLGEKTAWENRDAIYLASAACAEFTADIFLCPFEACRIRLVSQPDYASGMGATATKLMSEYGFIGAFYSGFVPILFKQIPYTMAKFAVQGKLAEAAYAAKGTSPDKSTYAENLQVSLATGFAAGVAAAIISHPADTLLSKINKAGAGGDGGMASRLLNIAKETGLVNLCTQGLGLRCAMIGTRTSRQLAVSEPPLHLIGTLRP